MIFYLKFSGDPNTEQVSKSYRAVPNVLVFRRFGHYLGHNIKQTDLQMPLKTDILDAAMNILGMVTELPYYLNTD